MTPSLHLGLMKYIIPLYHLLKKRSLSSLFVLPLLLQMLLFVIRVREEVAPPAANNPPVLAGRMLHETHSQIRSQPWLIHLQCSIIVAHRSGIGTMASSIISLSTLSLAAAYWCWLKLYDFSKRIGLQCQSWTNCTDCRSFCAWATVRRYQCMCGVKT